MESENNTQFTNWYRNVQLGYTASLQFSVPFSSSLRSFYITFFPTGEAKSKPILNSLLWIILLIGLQHEKQNVAAESNWRVKWDWGVFQGYK